MQRVRGANGGVREVGGRRKKRERERETKRVGRGTVLYEWRAIDLVGREKAHDPQCESVGQKAAKGEGGEERA